MVGIATDDDFFESFGTLLQQCGGNDKEAERLANSARAQGYEPGPNDLYYSPIAQKPGDPNAFIKRGDGKAEIKKRAEEANIELEGSINTRAVKDLEPKKKVPLAEATVKRRMKAAIKRDPSLARKKGELREKIIDTHSFKGV